MKLILKSDDFKHIKEKSYYNHNFFRYIGGVKCYPTEILEESNEDYNFSTYYLIKDENKLFLGCSGDTIGTNAIIKIDFQLYYT